MTLMTFIELTNVAVGDDASAFVDSIAGKLVCFVMLVTVSALW